METRQHKHDQSQWLNRDQTLKRFAEVLASTDVSKVSCSVKLREPSAPKKETVWKREAIQRRSVSSVNSFLRTVGVYTPIYPQTEFAGELIGPICLRSLPDYARVVENVPSCSPDVDGLAFTSKTAFAFSPVSSSRSPLQAKSNVGVECRTQSTDDPDACFDGYNCDETDDSCDPDFHLLR